MNLTTLGKIVRAAARTGGYIAIHPSGHSSHGPLPTKAAAVAALDHLTRTGKWPEVTA